MKDVITYVGIDAHKKDLFIAMLVGTQATPLTWTVANEPNASATWCGSSSGRRQARCDRVMKRDRAATPCNGG